MNSGLSLVRTKDSMLSLKKIEIPGYEEVIEAENPSCGLHCFIAIHNTSLGPSLGGVRIHPYASRDAALQDALQLSKAMTYKSAVAEDGLGGGKSVIIADPYKEKTPELLYAFAEVLDTLKGKYIAAEDVGTSPLDMAILKQRTPYVAALISQQSSGDPSRFTAWGVYRGMQAVASTLWKTKSLRNKKIAIQGLGHVGGKLATLLFWEGAELIICDTNKTLVSQYAHECGAEVVAPEEICKVECDILSPCALGGAINPTSINQLHCKAIAGAANNQLSSEDLAWQLLEKNILYATDYIINAGGIINAAAEFDDNGYEPISVRNKVDHIYEILLNLFQKSSKQKQPTNFVADEIAEYNLKHGIGKRQKPIFFKH